MDGFIDNSELGHRIQELKLQNKVVPPEDEEKLEDMKKEALDICLAYLFTRNSDKKRYQSKVDFYAARYADKQNEYPEHIDDAVEALSAHRVDNEGKSKNQDGKRHGCSKTPKRGNRDSDDSNVDAEASLAQKQHKHGKRCRKCGDEGHFHYNCTKEVDVVSD